MAFGLEEVVVLEMVLVLPLAANRDSPPVPFVIPIGKKLVS